MFDLHSHSEFSPDGSYPMTAIRDVARLRGIRVMAITDHADFDVMSRPEQSPLDLSAYHQSFQKMMETKRQGDPECLLGIELGLIQYASQENQRMVRQLPFDIIIGSVHNLYNFDINRNPMVKWVDNQVGMIDYYREIWCNLKTFRDFDTLGHMDYIDRIYPHVEDIPDFASYRMSVEAVLKLLIKYDIALEVNTAGLRRRLGRTYPKREILELYRDLGGKMLTVGSDAHRLQDVGAGIEEALELIREVGFTSVFTFRKRVPVEWGI